MGIPTIQPFVPKSDLRWLYKAKCRKEDSELFFPNGHVESHGPVSELAWRRARAICFECPVKDDCREEYWDETSLNIGMLFGMTPREREKYRYNRRRKMRKNIV